MSTCGDCKHRQKDGWCARHNDIVGARMRSCVKFEPKTRSGEYDRKFNREALLKQVAEMYNRGDKIKHIAQAVGYSSGGVSTLVNEAYDLGLIDTFRRPEQREANKRRKGVIVVPVDQTKSNGQATAKPAIANEEEAAMLFEALTALNEDSLRALYGEIEREMGRRVLRGV